jgi:hypothetical protein
VAKKATHASRHFDLGAPRRGLRFLNVHLFFSLQRDQWKRADKSWGVSGVTRELRMDFISIKARMYISFYFEGSSAPDFGKDTWEKLFCQYPIVK